MTDIPSFGIVHSIFEGCHFPDMTYQQRSSKPSAPRIVQALGVDLFDDGSHHSQL
jgi:hypothetical protein